ncbi:FAD-dependent oxidoreductase [Salibacterium aidingense]|uniref:FAD-dependent oxidoreductase n=1 Tax=Salibacterium aidingense TaxID=384933 RepID=UPI0003FEA690|nr:FAD-dependent oxidoreductase [Salibacterium aidingense]
MSTDSSQMLPVYPRSLWRESEDVPSFPKIEEDLSVDVTIVGAGITGFTAAYLLAMEGVNVALVEAKNVLEGTTGYTTAKISSQHGLIYEDLIRTFGEEKAQLYFQANEKALSFIHRTAEKRQIDCDLRTDDVYLYTSREENRKQVEKEAKAYEKLGINGGSAASEIDLPYQVKEALVLRNQAQFHPVKFCRGLVRSIQDNGGLIFEQTRVVDIHHKDKPEIKTAQGYRVQSSQVIVSSHFPFNDSDGKYYSRLHAERSYVLAVRPRSPIPKGMYINADSPVRSLRSAPMEDGEDLLLIGGESHPVGKHEENTSQKYQKLKEYGEKYFGIEAIPYRWSAQDLVTLDKVPYIGPMVSGKENVLVATGYAKWGMSNGIIAGSILSDHVLQRENEYSSLFDPTRKKRKREDIVSFVKENTDVGKELVKGKLKQSQKGLKELEHDEGAVVEWNGKKAGAYRNQKGELFLVDTTCTHMGCEVVWNDGERSWDCPCHGSRFSYTGEVIEGPAAKPLEPFTE